MFSLILSLKILQIKINIIENIKTQKVLTAKLKNGFISFNPTFTVKLITAAKTAERIENNIHIITPHLLCLLLPIFKKFINAILFILDHKKSRINFDSFYKLHISNNSFKLLISYVGLISLLSCFLKLYQHVSIP